MNIFHIAFISIKKKKIFIESIKKIARNNNIAGGEKYSLLHGRGEGLREGGFISILCFMESSLLSFIDKFG
jgi:hypothetical protein